MSTIYSVRVLRLPNTANLTSDLPLPAYEGAHAAGLDLLAAVDAPIVIAPGARAAIPTGIVCVIPPGLEAQIRTRTGLAFRFGVIVLNSHFDADYRGEMQAILANFGAEPFTVERGASIAQLVFCPTVQVNIREISRAEDA